MLCYIRVALATIVYMDIAVIRKTNLNLLLAQNRAAKAGTQKAWATRVGLAPDHVTQMKNGHRDMGGDVARRIERKMKLPIGWMDQKRDTIDSVTLAPSDHDVDVMTYSEFIGGRTADNQGSDDSMESVKEAWIADRGYSLEYLFSKRFCAKNMRPNYIESDVVLINTDWGEKLKNDCVYAFGKLGHELTYHRVLHRANGGITLSNDNKGEYPDENVDADSIGDLNVIGEVVRLVRDF